MLDILRNRRSIRRFKDKEIEQELIERLKEAALRSPTSRGINPWRFLFVTDRALLEELSRAKESGSSFLKGARLGVVIIAMEGESDVWVEDCSIASIILQLTGQSLGLGSCWIQIIRMRLSKNYKIFRELKGSSVAFCRVFVENAVGPNNCSVRDVINGTWS
jgi:nitroreductase